MAQRVRTAIRKAWRPAGATGLVAVAVAVGLLLWLSHGSGAGATSQVQLSSQQSQQSQRSSQERTYLADGWWAQQPLYRPAAVTLSADGSFLITKMAWSSWTTSEASGVGTGRVNDCEPNCVSGTYRNYPVSVRLETPKEVCGRHFFTSMTVTWTGAVPSGWSRSQTWPQVVQC